MRYIFHILAILSGALMISSCSKMPTRNNPYDTHYDLPGPENVQIEHISLTIKKISWEYEIENIDGFKISRKLNDVWLEEIVLSSDERVYIEEDIPVNLTFVLITQK